jgi:hypothetical protein
MKEALCHIKTKPKAKLSICSPQAQALNPKISKDSLLILPLQAASKESQPFQMSVLQIRTNP